MKSPFKMTPGRGNMPKTGRGISPALMSKSPMKQELTAQGLKSQKKVKANISNEAKKQGTSTPTLPNTGVKVNAATGEATAKSYEKKYVEGGAGQSARIIGGDGKVVGSSKGSTPNAKAKLKAEFEKLKTATEESRKKNASKAEVFAGAKKVLTAAEEKMQANLGNTKSPAKMKVSKKTAYDIKEASNQKLKPGARKHYAENAQAAMKNKKSPAKQMSKLKKKC